MAYDSQRIIDWYNQRSENYDQLSFSPTDERYGGDLYRMQIVREIIQALGPKKVLDAGCGTGEPMMYLTDIGCDVVGFDLSDGMVAQAKAKLRERGLDEGRVRVADVLDRNTLSPYAPQSFDAVVANGLMPYIADDDLAHQNLLRLVRPGGYFISAYSNAMFDLFTFNRFTVDFFRKNFFDWLDLPADLCAELDAKLKNIIPKHDKPKSIPEGARDFIYVRSHNPYEVEGYLRDRKFNVVDCRYYKFHAFPPLLADTPKARAALFEHSRKCEVVHAKDWRAKYMCSTFIMVAKHEG